MTSYRNYPELRPGIRVYYKDRDDKTRAEQIINRNGNKITVINALKQPTRIECEKVIGYWEPRVKANFANMIRIKKEVKTDARENKTRTTAKIRRLQDF